MHLLRLELNSVVLELQYVLNWPSYAKVLHRLLSAFAHIMPADVRAPLRRFYSWYLDHRVQFCVWHKLKNTKTWKEKIGMDDSMYGTLMEYVYSMEYAHTEADYLTCERSFGAFVDGLFDDASLDPAVVSGAKQFYMSYMDQFGTGSEFEGLCNRYARRDFYQWVDASQTVESLHWVKKGSVLERWLRRRDGGWVLYRFVGAPSSLGVGGSGATEPGAYRAVSAAEYGKDMSMVSHFGLKRAVRLDGHKTVEDRSSVGKMRAAVCHVLMRNKGNAVSLLRDDNICRANGIFSVVAGKTAGTGDSEVAAPWTVNVAANRCSCPEVHSCKHVHACRIFILDQMRTNPSGGLTRMWVDTDSETLAPPGAVVLSKKRKKRAPSAGSACGGAVHADPAPGAGALPRGPAADPGERFPNLFAGASPVVAQDQVQKKQVHAAMNAIVRQFEGFLSRGDAPVPEAKHLRANLAQALEAARKLATSRAAADASGTVCGSDEGQSDDSVDIFSSGGSGESESDDASSVAEETPPGLQQAAAPPGVLGRSQPPRRRTRNSALNSADTTTRIRHEMNMADKHPMRANFKK